MRSYRAKMVESIRLPPREDRERALERAGYNVFNLASDDVFIDLLTDSGTGTMSDEQWAALIRGDESYAGSRSFERLQASVRDVMGFEHVVPTHQGRGAENVLYGCLLDDGDVATGEAGRSGRSERPVVPNNTHFDTTRAHVANQGADAVDCPVDGAWDYRVEGDFLGNLDLEAARAVVDDVGADRVPVVISTITNNSAAGQPVSMRNLRDTAAFADEIDATFVIDACRFAENAHFIKRREDGYADVPHAEIAREQLSYADAITMSGKKDALVNIGGFCAMRDTDLLERCKQRAILYEGFPTYGGLAGRDLEAMAVGLREAVEPPYVAERVEQVAEFAALLAAEDIPVVTPPGGHAVYVDAGALIEEIPRERFPGQRFVAEMYREGGVRSAELGEFAFPGANRPQYVRFAVPRRTYWREHFEHVAETAATVREKSGDYAGLEIVTEPPMKELRHFTAELQPVES